MGEETVTRDILLEDEIQSNPTFRSAFAVLSDENNRALSATELATLIAKRDLIVEKNTIVGQAKEQILSNFKKAVSLIITAICVGITGTALMFSEKMSGMFQ